MKRAPYFAAIVERQHRNPRFSWRLIATGTQSERWGRAQYWMRPGWPGGTLLVPDADPLSIRWPRGTAIVDATNQPGQIVERLARALIRDGCTHAVLIDVADPTRSTHVKRLRQQVAA